MDPDPSEPAKLGPSAQRARTIIVVVTVVFIIAPFVVYVLFGRGVVPRQ